MQCIKAILPGCAVSMNINFKIVLNTPETANVKMHLIIAENSGI